MTPEQYIHRALLVAEIIEAAEVAIEEEKKMRSIPPYAEWNNELFAVLRGKKDYAEHRFCSPIYPKSMRGKS